ncbi:class I SAM-dependent methyltransferase [Vibrio vulnificus]|uniref:class I SAM-dependent methyltransferase n=1 Tax=Vibrio vulnificus TaxID=672 RepID=UPI0018F7E4A2|nr:class I SAM-dependent methyltransferase [Vibrio vulnificus]EHU4846367.1 class I SAM-dependent methyltransferase [Vibrio vulnificus]EHU5127712.1 class I SAM-dependent methyltransferase [Vibrio vulnificus]EHV9035009.1 class I SAM-dependent methyltransferase [Vibrio vulnificus]EHV9587393.1 class I SAM-dependent methyltransferase [Vibrio vulnificus]EHW0624960.1 class I SAM-dependent methyltransferase [Vibrio vulnificus]
MTDQYYTENAQSFFESTVSVDVQKLYDQFLPHLDPNSAILDAGCGSGRDAKHFKALGFRVTAFDANQALVELASRHLEQHVIHAKFDTFRAEPNSFDGIWACASLLHVPDKELGATFLTLSQLLRPQGLFYCSFKYGQAAQVRNGRFFTDMDEHKLHATLTTSPLTIKQTWVTSDVRPGRGSEQWLNAILIRR